MDGSDFRRLVEDVESLAERELRSVAMVGRRLEVLPGGVLEERNGSAARGLDELRRRARDLTLTGGLDSGRAAPRFRIFPRRDPARAYLDRWARAQKSIEGIVVRLRDAATRLRQDSAQIAEELLALDSQVATLTRYANLSQRLDERLSSHIDGISQADPSRAAILRQELLLVVRTRRRDILTNLTVAIQGQAALRILEENNDQLVDAISRATTSVTAALQTGAVVRQALELRRRLQAGLDGDGAEPEVGESGTASATVAQAWAEVRETLNEVERLRRRVVEAAAALGSPEGDLPAESAQ
ncbi:MAG: hypothetical protein QOE92_527 [Chloroflexota bacterium]|nr:hypothetical protein [Chloroflexota bacterium]